MTLAQETRDFAPAYLAPVKQISGRHIELERRRQGLSQVTLGHKAGLGPAWLRHLEGGDTRVRLDDHLGCLYNLDTSPLVVTVPMLFAAHGREFPPHLLSGDLKRLEILLIETVVNWNLENLRSLLHPGQG